MLIDDLFLNQIQTQAKESPRLRMNYNLHDSFEEKAQKLLNVLEPGTQFKIHRHSDSIACVFILRGKVDYIFYNEQGEETERFHLDASQGNYGVKIPVGTWHSMEVLEPSAIYEVKDGPYRPLSEKDILKLPEK